MNVFSFSLSIYIYYPSLSFAKERKKEKRQVSILLVWFSLKLVFFCKFYKKI